MEFILTILLVSFLSIPFSDLLFFLANMLLLRLVAPLIGTHPCLPPGSLFFGHRHRAAKISGDGDLHPADVRGGNYLEEVRYQSSSPVVCVFCLSDIEEGEEVRELRCQHLFHRRCLDTWLACRRATCPLCRDALREGEEEEEEEELEYPAMAWLAYAPSWEKVLRMVMPIMDGAIKEVCKFLPAERLVVVDLGCSSGPNTFLVVSEVLKVVGNEVAFRNTADIPLEIQFYLNDLPGNDFNQIFRSLDQFNKKVKEQMSSSIPYYVVGLPGTFHGRILPYRSVHFFHSSMSIQWLSQMPQGIERLNKKNIYIAKSSPPQVLRVYREQYQRDFSCFLQCRHAELSDEGRMLLSLPGRKNHDQPHQGFAYLFQLLAQALYDLVLEGRVAEEKLDNFNVPFYCPSMEEMEKMIDSQGLFSVERAETFEAKWDPADESEDDSDLDALQSGKNVAKYVRAGFGVLLAHQFGEEVLDEAFSRYAANVSTHLLKEKTKHLFLFILLKKRALN